MTNDKVNESLSDQSSSVF